MADKISHNVDTVVIAGISGSGKTTLAKALAQHFSTNFLEADDYHSHTAKQKMASGIALDDHDRLPWLKELNAELHNTKPSIIACSALKEHYRNTLTEGLNAKYIWLSILPELAEERLANRPDHFMPASLINSQLATAEQPQNALLLQAGISLDTLVEKSVRYIMYG